MRLCEVVRGSRTSPKSLRKAIDIARRIGKVAVVSGDHDGFIGNRMIAGYVHQVDHLLLEGTTPSQIDGALQDFGMVMGPFRMNDMAGMDVAYLSRKNYDPATIEARAATVSDRLIESGRLGQKSGGGYCDYPRGDRDGQPSSAVQALVETAAAELGIRHHAIRDDEIVQRSLLELVNIGCNMPTEGTAIRPSDIDMVYLNGYGFPPYRSDRRTELNMRSGWQRRSKRPERYRHSQASGGCNRHHGSSGWSRVVKTLAPNDDPRLGGPSSIGN